MSQLRFTRSVDNRLIGGVCGGLGDYLGVDPTLVRIAFVFLGLASGVGIPLYLLMLVIVPRDEHEGQPISQVVKDNLDDLGQTISGGAERLQSSPDGRRTAAVLLILLGAFLLPHQLGLLGGGLIWPLLLIGLGAAVIWYKRG